MEYVVFNVLLSTLLSICVCVVNLCYVVMQTTTSVVDYFFTDQNKLLQLNLTKIMDK